MDYFEEGGGLVKVSEEKPCALSRGAPKTRGQFVKQHGLDGSEQSRSFMY